MKELKTFLPLVVVLLVFAIFFSSLGLASSPFNLVWSIFASDYGIVVLGGNAAPFFALHLFGRPRRNDTLIVLIAAALFAVVWFVLFPFQGAALFRHWYYYSVPGAGLGLASLGCMVLRSRSADVEEQDKNRRLLAAAVLVMGIGLIIEPYLGLTSALHPQTFDAVALHFDATLGFSPSVLVALIAAYLQPLDRVVSIGYHSLPYMFCTLYALQVTQRQKPPVSFLAVWVLGTAAGFIAYQFLPIAGPKYAFGSQFPAFLPPLSQIPTVEVLVPPAARNGMPSMHFGWALALWMNACFLGSARLRAFFAVFLALTGLATLALGEHYLIDLVVAVPFMVAVQALATTSIPLGDPAKKRLLIVTGALVMAWYLAVRWGLGLFTSVPGLTWAFIAATLAAVIYVYRPFAKRSSTPVLESQSTPAAQAMPRDFLAIAALFVASGFAGLMYEVLFSKALALTFGSTATANYTVLATYMGGMAVGAWLGGKFVALHRRPMLSYALCELVIGLYCVATPAIFAGIRGLYVGMAGDLPPDAGILTLARFTLGGLGMVVPTVLMGMTLPILASYFDKRAESLGRSVAVLYGANTIGAAMGALLTGYWILPGIGVFKTTLLACALNLTVAVIAIELHKRLLPAKGGPMAEDAPLGAAVASVDDRNAGWMALVVLGIGGMVTLALEVIYIHLLAIVAGNSTYAFALMLSTFLIGLALGAGVARRLLMMALSPLALLVCLEFGLALVMLLGLTQWNDLPGYFAGFASYPLARTFGEREFIRGVVCCVAMLPPAFCIGALYPLCMECIGRARPERKVQWLGTSAAVNTAGNIVGVLVGGFVLLPLLGPLNAVHVLAATCFTLGAIALWVGRRLLAKPLWALPAVVAAVFIFQPSTLDYTELSSGANVYFARQGFGQVVDHAESIDGGLTSVARSNDGKKVVLTLLTNGKFQGNNVAQGEMKAQVGVALSPLLHTRQRRDALVIGYGTGVSARALSDAGFARIDVVDLSADIVTLANRHFSDVNANVATRPGVHMHITDGRNYLLLQRRDYDVISMEVSSIWFAGAASLYNREFYQLAKKRLRPAGVLQQWMQLHHISMLDIVIILGSVRAEFDYVWLYLIGGQGMIIASNSPDAFPNRQNAALLDATPTLQDLVKLLDGGAEGVRKELILDPQALDRLLENSRLPLQYRVSTDDNLFLEYSTPKGNALGSNAARDNLVKITRLSRGAKENP